LIIYGFAQGAANQIVAIGRVMGGTCVDAGFIFYSSDGRKWTQIMSNLRSIPTGLAYGNGRFVILGSPGTGAQVSRLYVSSDGIDWSQQEFAPAKSPTGIAFGNGFFLVPEVNGTGLLRSTDGSNWQRFMTNLSTFSAGVVFAAGVFAIYADNLHAVYTTSDLQDFTRVDATKPGNTEVTYQSGDRLRVINDHFFGETYYHGYSDPGGDTTWYGYTESSDGVTWTQRPIRKEDPYPLPLILNSSVCIAIVDDYLVTGPTCDETQRTVPGFLPNAALATGSLYLVGGRNGIIVSQDGKTWEKAL
jgi:hypothetical protein